MFLVTGVLKTLNFSTFNHFTSMKGWIFLCKIKGIKKMQINVSFLPAKGNDSEKCIQE